MSKGDVTEYPFFLHVYGETFGQTAGCAEFPSEMINFARTLKVTSELFVFRGVSSEERFTRFTGYGPKVKAIRLITTNLVK